MSLYVNGIVKVLKITILALLLAIVISPLYAAWINPTVTPPSENVGAPINIGGVTQIKDGALGVASLAVFGNGYFSGDVGVGVLLPNTKIDIAGEVKVGNTDINCDEDVEGALRYNQNDKAIEFCDGDDWKTFGGALDLVISSDTLNYNILQEAGSPTEPIDIIITIEAGIVVGSSSTSLPSITTGDLPSGSSVKIINYGIIAGKGGNGGRGSCAWWSCTSSAGETGGDAIHIFVDTTIENHNRIYGGGGGGGGAGFTYNNTYCTSGGGGGGGAGWLVGVGGVSGQWQYNQRYYCPSTKGTDGSIEGYPPPVDARRGGDNYYYDGGWGGWPGGNAGNGTRSGGSGGLAGKAIVPNGNILSIPVLGNIIGSHHIWGESDRGTLFD